MAPPAGWLRPGAAGPCPTAAPPEGGPPLLPHRPPHKQPANSGGPSRPSPGREGQGQHGLQLPGNLPADTPQLTAAPGRPGQSLPLTWKQQGTLKAERAAATSSCLLTPTHPSPTGGSRHQPLLSPPAPATRTCVGRRGAAPLTTCVVSPSPPTWTAPSLQVLVTL